MRSSRRPYTRWYKDVSRSILVMNHTIRCDPLRVLAPRPRSGLRGGEAPEAPVVEAEQTGRVMLVSKNAFIEACAYSIANPVAAGLVHDVSEWTSFVSSASDMLTGAASPSSDLSVYPTATGRRPPCACACQGRDTASECSLPNSHAPTFLGPRGGSLVSVPRSRTSMGAQALPYASSSEPRLAQHARACVATLLRRGFIAARCSAMRHLEPTQRHRSRIV